MRNNKERIKAEAKEKLPRRMSIGKRIAIIAAVAFSVLAMTLVGAFSFAYFSKRDIYKAYMGGNVQLLFARLTVGEPGNEKAGSLYQYQLYLYNQTLPADQQTDTLPTEGDHRYDSSAEWGSERNPYIISEIKHLYNLSELQNIGFFEKEYINKNYDEVTGEYNGGNKIPYFRVCNETNGQPVAIMGGDVAIETIGTEEFPFVGSIKGAFVTGDDIKVRVGENGLYSDTSVIYNVEAFSNEKSVDVGLFGHITCLGTPSTDGTAFAGQVSEVSDLLLYDVTVKVDSESWLGMWEAVVDHVFSYKKLTTEEAQAAAPHETHHIGILAGHVTYSRISNISVYYSDQNKSAIDLSHVATKATDGDLEYLANYMSVTGFVGYLDGMNPIVNENGSIEPNTGTGNGGLIFGSGQGGGGLMSGNYTGYVVAQRVLDLYRYGDDQGGTPPVVKYPDAYNDKNNNNDEPVQTPVYLNGLYTQVTKDENGNELEKPTYKALCADAGDGKYYFRDGVFTFVLSTVATDTIEPTWWQLDANGKPIETFQIGADDVTQWVANSALPPDSVLAYVRQVTSDVELAAAIKANKQVLILNETDNAALQEKLYIMSLYEMTEGEEGNNNLNTKFYTSGLAKDFATSDQIQTYIDAYNNNIWSIPSMTSSGSFTAPTTPAEMAAALNPSSGSLKAIYLGDATQTETIETIFNQYAITVTPTGNSSLAERDTGLPVSTDSDGEVIEYFYYSRATYPTTVTDEQGNTGTAQVSVSGYFICIFHDGWGILGDDDSYTYYWQPINGERVRVEQINGTALGTTTNLTAFWNLMTPVENTPADQPVTVLSATINDETAPVVGGVLYQSNVTLGETSDFTLCESADNRSTTIEWDGEEGSGDFKIIYGTPLNAWIHNLTGDKDEWYYYNPTANTTVIAAPTLTATGKVTTGSGLPIYKDANNNEGIVVNMCPTYNFSRPVDGGDTNYLRLMTLTYSEWFQRGTYYPLWVGSDTQAKTPANFSNVFVTEATPSTMDSSKDATVTFSATNGANIFFLQTTDNQVRYVDYSYVPDAVDAYQQRFGSSIGKPAVTEGGVTNKLYIYVIEGTQSGKELTDKEANRMIIVPDENTPQATYNPADYLLFASSSDADVQTDPNLLGFTNGSPNGIYTVTKLSDLGWKDGIGSTLSDATAQTLHKKFCITEGIDFKFQLNLNNILGFLPSINSPGFITAPVGTYGQEANIPQGCVAYRKNTTTTDPQEINVIVAVPVSDTYYGEGNETFGAVAERYFNLWVAPEAGTELWQDFDPDDSVDRFALPHSNPYSKDWTGTGNGTAEWDANQNINYIKVKADLDGNGAIDNVTYRSYLNGDRVLIAYSFSITEEGVYIMGASGKNAAGETVSVPMEIVYFSAPGGSSAGDANDAPTSQLGTIDFVYANEETKEIITVKPTTSKPANLQTDYYPSYSFFYFETNLYFTAEDKSKDYIEIDYGKIRLRRTVSNETTSTITWTPTMDDTKVQTYGRYIRFSQQVPGEIITDTTNQN